MAHHTMTNHGFIEILEMVALTLKLIAPKTLLPGKQEWPNRPYYKFDLFGLFGQFSLHFLETKVIFFFLNLASEKSLVPVF